MDIYTVRVWRTKKSTSGPAFFQTKVWAENPEQARRLVADLPPGTPDFTWEPVPLMEVPR